MKSLTILLVLSLSMAFAHAQSVYEPTQLIWDSVAIQEKKAKFLNVSEVDITTYFTDQKRRTVPVAREVRTYGDEGNLLQMVIMNQKDTNMVQKFFYSRGKLGWTETENRQWNRSYLEQVRLTSHKAPYQIKSYELLRHDQRLLLDTRQYIYNTDSMLIAIRILENRRIIRVHRFQYDTNNMLVKEIFEDGKENVLEEVSYAYDGAGYVQQVTIDRDGESDVYTYQYDRKGLPVQALWRNNGVTKGLVFYQYNQSGLVTEVKQVMNPEMPTETQLVKVVAYQ